MEIVHHELHGITGAAWHRVLDCGLSQYFVEILSLFVRIAPTFCRCSLPNLNNAWLRIACIHFAEEGRINRHPADNGHLKGANFLHEKSIALVLMMACYQRNE